MKTIILSAVFIRILFLMGCDTQKYALYKTTTINTQMPKKAGDYSISGNISSGSAATNALCMLSPYKNILMYGSYGNDGGTDSTSVPNYFRYFEGGIGYYKTIKRGNRTLTPNVLIGYSNGLIKDHNWHSSEYFPGGYYAGSLQQLTSHINKGFVQPGFEITKRKYSLSVACKLSQVKVKAVAGEPAGPYYIQLLLQPGTYNYSFATLEPCLTFSYHTRYISPYVQLSQMYPLQNNSPYYQVVTDPDVINSTHTSIAMGLSLSSDNCNNMARIFRKHKKDAN